MMRPSRMATACTMEPLASAVKTVPLRYTRSAAELAAKDAPRTANSAKRQKANHRFMAVSCEPRSLKEGAGQQQARFDAANAVDEVDWGIRTLLINATVESATKPSEFHPRS